MSKKGSGPGRKPLPVGRAKKFVLQVRLKGSDRDKMAVTAERREMTLSEWAREVLLQAVRDADARVAEAEEQTNEEAGVSSTPASDD